MNSILCLNEECVDILASDGIYLKFQDIFKAITKFKNTLQCILDYAFFSNNLNNYLSFINDSYDNLKDINNPF